MDLNFLVFPAPKDTPQKELFENYLIEIPAYENIDFGPMKPKLNSIEEFYRLQKHSCLENEISILPGCMKVASRVSLVNLDLKNTDQLKNKLFKDEIIDEIFKKSSSSSIGPKLNSVKISEHNGGHEITRENLKSFDVKTYFQEFTHNDSNPKAIRPYFITKEGKESPVYSFGKKKKSVFAPSEEDKKNPKLSTPNNIRAFIATSKLSTIIPQFDINVNHKMALQRLRIAARSSLERKNVKIEKKKLSGLPFKLIEKKEKDNKFLESHLTSENHSPREINIRMSEWDEMKDKPNNPNQKLPLKRVKIHSMCYQHPENYISEIDNIGKIDDNDTVFERMKNSKDLSSNRITKASRYAMRISTPNQESQILKSTLGSRQEVTSDSLIFSMKNQNGCQKASGTSSPNLRLQNHKIPCLFYRAKPLISPSNKQPLPDTRNNILVIYLHANAEDFNGVSRICQLYHQSFNVNSSQSV